MPPRCSASTLCFAPETLPALLLILFEAGCPGTARVDPRRDVAVSVDWGTVDQSATVDQPVPDSAPLDAASGCLPEDAATTCDPLAPSGCPTGAGCYLVQGAYLDCVCPAGTVGVGGACTTTVQCQPGFGCVGDSPPGVCRQVCDPSAPACATGLTCKAAVLMPQYGMCVP